MSQKVLHRKHPVGTALEQSLAAIRNPNQKVSIANPPDTEAELKAYGDSFTLASFTTEDAWELGHLLHARLTPLAAAGRSTVISISLANSSQVLFHCVTGPGIKPDNDFWVERKRNSVLRFGTSTWLLHCRFKGDEELFASKYGMGKEQAGKYAIHGGGVPIRVQGVEGIVAVVIVSGLQQHEDHGVIVDVISENWE